MAAVVVGTPAPRINGDGTSEAEWRRSPWLAALPSMEATTWLMGVARLVVVSPHPDDEVLGAGGLIATARASGIPVCVVSVTDGEACYPGAASWTSSRLRIVRRQELSRALACLGVDDTAVRTLDVGDGRVGAHEDALAEALRHLLEQGDRLLTTWRNDGHPDHEAAARAVDRAGADCGVAVAQFPVWAWHWMSPAGSKTRLPAARRCVLAADAARAKARALACFASQRRSGEPGLPPILPAHVLARFERDYEVVLP